MARSGLGLCCRRTDSIMHFQQATMRIAANRTHNGGLTVPAHSRGSGVQETSRARRTLTGTNSAAAVKLTPLPSLKKSGGVELERMGANAGAATRSALCRADSCAGGLPRLTAPAHMALITCTEPSLHCLRLCAGQIPRPGVEYGGAGCLPPKASRPGAWGSAPQG